MNVSDELVELARNHEKRKNRIEKSLIDNGGLEPLVIGIMPTRPCTHKSRLVSGGWSMSALPPETDIRQRIEHVCFVPIAESCTAPPTWLNDADHGLF